LKLRIPGEDEFEGFLEATAFLRKVNLGDKKPPGRNVCIIGGGNSAIDAARTALRLGAEAVHIIYRREREQMPANPLEIEAALHEGIQITYLASPIGILGENGRVAGIECIRNKLGKPDASGRRRPVPIEGSEFRIACDTIFPAIGQEPDLAWLNGEPQLEINRRNRLVVDEKTLQTNIPGFYAGGDAVTGPATVVQAIAAGHRAAVSIDCYLRGEEYNGYWFPKPHLVVDRLELTEADESLIRPSMKEQPVDERVTDFREVELCLDKNAAQCEAKRCLRCDL
jgi:NADPH-dependent glutamate synthase beta subunit-like oxidoreductase